MSERIWIPDIEASLIGAWASENDTSTFNFFPAPDTQTPGQLDIFHNNNFNEVGYRIFIKDNTPHIQVINAENEKAAAYTIADLNKEQHILTLVTDAGETIILHKK